MKWSDIDDEYCFSFVYKGAFQREICVLVPRDPKTGVKPEGLRMQRDDVGDFFIGVVPGESYEVIVIEDEAAGIGADGIRLNDGPLNLSNSKRNQPGPRSGNAAVADITKELLAMDVKNLHTDEARRLREARDVEDVLFSST